MMLSSCRTRSVTLAPPGLRWLSALALAGGLTAAAEAFGQEGDAPPALGNLGEAHAVSPGDTLWDLCAKYLNSPWYWPKIWSYNPQLTNPHWIYPGNEIRFYPGDDQLPTEIDVGRAITVEDDDLAVPGVLADEDIVKTVGTIETGRTEVDSIWTAFIGFITQDDRDLMGEIINSPSGAVMLSDGDRVYIEGGEGLRKGDRLAVYRAVRRIVHPITGESYGYAVEILGALDVVDTNPEVASADIFQAFRQIERGDFVGPWPENYLTRVQPVPATANAKGYVLETTGEVLGPIGEHDMIYIDRGRNHGVQNGNIFTVYHRGDRFTGETRKLPNEAVGRAMVIDAREEASTAVVVGSVLEIRVGDKIELTARR